MKQITEQQIKAILDTVYTTNIPAQTFDALKQMFITLPEVKVAKEVAKEEKK